VAVSGRHGVPSVERPRNLLEGWPLICHAFTGIQQCDRFDFDCDYLWPWCTSR